MLLPQKKANPGTRRQFSEVNILDFCKKKDKYIRQVFILDHAYN